MTDKIITVKALGVIGLVKPTVGVETGDVCEKADLNDRIKNKQTIVGRSLNINLPGLYIKK